jgi:hypothetical protein
MWINGRTVLALSLAAFGCSLAHQYRSGEVTRLHVYDDEALARDLLPCEVIGGGGELRRDTTASRMFVRTALSGGPDCSGPLTLYVLTFQKGMPTKRRAVSEDALDVDDGKSVRIGGRNFGAHRDQSGGEYFYVRRPSDRLVIVEVMALANPDRVLARSELDGFPTRLFTKGDRHFVCGWLRDSGQGQGACDTFESSGATAEWRLVGRLTFGNHHVVDVDPESNSILVETPRDDLEPLLFTVDLPTWQWTYIGAGPSWSLLFMSADPLGRPSHG